MHLLAIILINDSSAFDINFLLYPNKLEFGSEHHQGKQLGDLRWYYIAKYFSLACSYS